MAAKVAMTPMIMKEADTCRLTFTAEGREGGRERERERRRFRNGNKNKWLISFYYARMICIRVLRYSKHNFEPITLMMSSCEYFRLGNYKPQYWENGMCIDTHQVSIKDVLT